MTTTPGRGPYAKTAGRIERILDVALELFAANGYRSSTMKEIAEQAGLSQAGLMHHFPTKEDVLVALLRRRDERSPALTPEAAKLPPLDRLLTIVDDITGQPTLAALHCVLSAEATAPDHPAHTYFQNRYRTFIGRATDAFTDLQRRGELRADANPGSLARLLIGVLDGLQLQWLLNPDTVKFPTELRAFLTLCAP